MLSGISIEIVSSVVHPDPDPSGPEIICKLDPDPYLVPDPILDPDSNPDPS
jgi:hypothetical protein